MAEPFAFAKLATRGDVLKPFYIDDRHVKERDATGHPTKIEVVLGRSPPPQQPGHAAVNTDSYNADYRIGARMKISKKHAMIYWNDEKSCFCIKSICKNAVRVNGQSYPGSPEGNAGAEACLTSQCVIEIADSAQIYFLMPKPKAGALQKPRQTYEQLVSQIMDPTEKLSWPEIVGRIKERFAYYNDPGLDSSWQQSLRSTLMQKTRSFTKVTEFDAAGKKSVYFKRATEDSSASKVATAGVTAGPVLPAAGSTSTAQTSGVNGGEKGDRTDGADKAIDVIPVG